MTAPDTTPITEVEPVKTKGKGITGTGLKLIAVITMLIDHIAAVIIEPLCVSLIPADLIDDVEALTPWMMEHKEVAILNVVMLIMRLIGRMAFPIFVFLLIEGFTHTHSVWKYAGNLLLFALISEVPFNLSHTGTILNFEFQSVYVTLLLGLVCVFILSKVEPINAWYRYPLLFVVTASFAVATLLLKTDYAASGVLTIVAMYLLRRKKMIAFAVGCAVLTFLASPIEVVAFFMLFVIAKYNGERGMKVNKYLYYGFYPAHLLILYLIAFLMGVHGFGLMPETSVETVPEQGASIVEPVKKLKLNPYSETFIPTAIVKCGDLYYIDDCYHDQIVFSNDLSKPLTEWQILADSESCGLSQSHTLAGDDVGNIVVDDTENNRVLIYESRNGDHKLAQIYNNMGNRPHYTIYHPDTDTFYVLSSCSGELFMFKKRESDGKLYHADTHVFEELKHIYVRSFTIDGDDVIFVSESGIMVPDDCQRLRENGTDAVLIGEMLMRSSDKGGLIREIKR